ncbi:MAG TPA: ATP-dependent DNA helicase RecG [Gemmatimonadaceae bacterium]
MPGLDTNVAYLKGVGPRRAEALHRLGVRTARDLLYHLPHRYHDASTIARISTLTPGMDATVIGTVISKGIIPTRKGLRIFQAVLKDRTGLIEAAWPGQPFLDRVVNKDDVLLVTGRVRFFHGRQLQPREMVNLGPASDSDDVTSGRVLAVYPATEGLSFKQIRAIVHAHLDALLPLVRESLPRDLMERAGVPPLREALRMVHRPASLEEAEHGRTRLALEEVLFVSLLQQRAKELARERRAGISFENKRELTSRLKRDLPFELTGAQTRAIREIVADMCSDRRMHRLLQGDVGSGKTVVALFAALLAVENGYQAAIMAPTELLAEQHARTFGRLLAPLGIEPVLVTGSLSAADRRARAARLAGRSPLIAVGTHALVQEDTRFGRLGFVAIDEQQRFGVEQRAALGAKAAEGAPAGRPDVLLLSATPIPRSLALTAFGDLDISVLDERPPGRLPVKTLLRPSSRRAAVLAAIERELAAGRQAYVVYPVIEESEKTDLKAAVTMHAELAAGPFAHRRVALLHGRLPSEERDQVMRQFRDHGIDILVATTVVEVGIDVPNATVMLIEHPERFGLSQLHQLRGRVGRGGSASYCILLGDPGLETRARLEVFVGTDDGFEIARADLRLRGMGDLFGAQQSGEPTFRIADPLKDESLFAIARAAAEEILASDPDLGHREHAPLRAALGERYRRAMELFRVG